MNDYATLADDNSDVKNNNDNSDNNDNDNSNDDNNDNNYDNNDFFMLLLHYFDVIMGAMASRITSLTIVYSTVYSDAAQGKHQSSASLAFVWGIHRGPVNSPHKWPVMRKMFPFDDVIIELITHSPFYVRVGVFVCICIMMTSSNGNIFCVTGHLCGEFTGPRWIPHTKASDAELWCFLWSAPE